MSPRHLSTQFAIGEIEERNCTWRLVMISWQGIAAEQQHGWWVSRVVQQTTSRKYDLENKLTMCTGMLLNQFISFIVSMLLLGRM